MVEPQKMKATGPKSHSIPSTKSQSEPTRSDLIILFLLLLCGCLRESKLLIGLTNQALNLVRRHRRHSQRLFPSFLLRNYLVALFFLFHLIFLFSTIQNGVNNFNLTAKKCHHMHCNTKKNTNVNSKTDIHCFNQGNRNWTGFLAGKKYHIV